MKVPCLVAAALMFSGAAAQDSERERATIRDAGGRDIGTAALIQTAHGVLVEIDAEKLPPGRRALHFHDTGECEAGQAFESAGDHFSPFQHRHGVLAEGGPHAGDLPNQYVGADGRLRAEIFAPQLTLRGGRAPLLDGDGAALVFHGEADDYRSQPSGGAGDRIACAAFSSRAGR